MQTLRNRAAPYLLAALAAGAADRAVAAQEPVPPHEAFTIQSEVMGEARRIAVYLPPGYDAAGATAYPVLYMPDGGVQEDFPHVAGTVDAAIRAGEMRPMLVVGIENTERRRDMTGPTEVAEDRRIAPRVGGSEAFLRFIADELMPRVRGRYRTTGETAIIGESLAGLFIVEAFLLRPELFDTYIALSPSLWWNAEALVRGAAARLDARPGLQARLYLSSADEEEIVAATGRLAEVLRAHAPAGVRWRYTPRPDLTHATIYRAAAPGVLRELFAPAAPSLTPSAATPGPPPAAGGDGLKGRRSEEFLALGGVVGGGAGLVVGMFAGALLDGDADEDCIDFCFGPGVVLGALAGEALGIALGVHLANGRRGSLPLGMLTSAGILTVGLIAGNNVPIMLLAVPVGQVIGAITAERRTTRRR